jgi:hypothetical protein
MGEYALNPGPDQDRQPSNRYREDCAQNNPPISAPDETQAPLNGKGGPPSKMQSGIKGYPARQV